MGDWIHSNLHTDLIKYVTDSQMYTSNVAIVAILVVVMVVVVVVPNLLLVQN